MANTCSTTGPLLRNVFRCGIVGLRLGLWRLLGVQQHQKEHGQPLPVRRTPRMGREILQLLRDIYDIPLQIGRSIHNASWKTPRRLYGSRPIRHHNVCLLQISSSITLLQHKNPADLSPCAEQHTYKSLAAPWDPSIKVLEIVYSDDRRGSALKTWLTFTTHSAT